MTVDGLIEDLPIQLVALSDLHQNPENPRTISEDGLARLVKSLRTEPRMLAARPVVALPDGTIIAGNMRWRAAGELGMTEIPTVYVDLSPEDAKLWLLRDNNEYGEWESEGLSLLLHELQSSDADLELSGFREDELTELLAVSDNGDGEKLDQGDGLATLDVSLGDPEHTVEKGDVWLLGGRHHLAVVSIYSGWPVFGPLLGEDDLLVPYPTPVVPITKRARERRLVLVQPDAWLAGHLLDKFAHVNGAEQVEKLG